MYSVKFRLILGDKNSFKFNSHLPSIVSIPGRRVNRQNVVATRNRVLYNSMEQQIRCAPRCTETWLELKQIIVIKNIKNNIIHTYVYMTCVYMCIYMHVYICI